MKTIIRNSVLAVACLSGFLLCGGADPSASNDDKASEHATLAPPVELRGRVVCLAEEMHQRFGTDLPTDHDHLWGFCAEDGSCYTLLRTRLSEALFVDPGLRQRELVLKARLLPGTRILDVTLFLATRDGELLDLYYYCEICSIKSVVPGPCMCCREPVELREERRETP